MISSTHYGRYALWLILGVTAVRVFGLPFSQVQLHGDEAQYWSWAQDLDFGYFSKPPLIAWIIAATTAVFGDAEWAARLGSPLFHALTATCLYFSGKAFFSAREGFWAALIFLLMPAVFLSSGIISTDVPLLTMWAFGLLCVAKLRAAPSWPWAVGLGVAIGIGLLAKYAMMFFLPALVLAVIFDKPLRYALASSRSVITVLVAGIIFAPNIIWNAQNGFQTVSHTAANTNLDGPLFHPLELLEFWFTQIGIFGPVLLVIYVAALISAFRKNASAETRLLAWFIIVPITIISIQALVSRANANWAVTSYVAACMLVARFVMARPNWRKAAIFGLAFNIFMGGMATAGGLFPGFADALGQANAFKRTRGWVETKEAIIPYYEAGWRGQNFDVIAFDHRLTFYDMNYYGLGETAPLKMWLYRSAPHNHAEATAPLGAGEQPVLLVNNYPDYADEFTDDFKQLERLGTIEIDLGGGKTRTLYMWAAAGYTPAAAR
ncbi:ArnT family glycosyltransferase [Robiginitomaculum antarcticum]|uniref:ArnT family glycosyltransferase n=1 Tax=Robiginitomaculum antarcticum TaxID=437507 RepID=UPI0003616E72|nr:glycosyltransferase family 39 protein [Robiginitomaculum antarcticum]